MNENSAALAPRAAPPDAPNNIHAHALTYVVDHALTDRADLALTLHALETHAYALHIAECAPPLDALSLALLLDAPDHAAAL